MEQEYQPTPRSLHLSCVVEGQTYIWGGVNKDLLEKKISLKEFTSVVSSFNPYLETWTSLSPAGSPPPGTQCGACASVGHHLYTYGGWNGDFDGCLNRLDTKTLEWNKLPSVGPMKKQSCGMIAYENQLVLFGGYGVPHGPTQPGSQFVPNGEYSDGRGWTNELHVFDVQKGVWSSPPVSGTRPPPCAAFSLTKLDEHTAALFGGKCSGKRCNDVYTIDLKKMHWTKVEFCEGGPCPVKRAGHVSVCLDYNGEHPLLLVTGGVDEDTNVLRDMWTLDTQSGRWTKIKVPHLQPRFSHSATSFTLGPGMVEVAVFGGCSEWTKMIAVDMFYLSNTTLLRFERQEVVSSDGAATREWVVTDVADNNQRGTSQHIREKMVKLSQVTHSSVAMPVVTCGAEREAVRELKDRVREAERRAGEAERGLEVAEKRAGEAERRAEEAERRASRAERRIGEALRGWEEAEKKVGEVERREGEAVRGWEEAERKMEEVETRAKQAEAMMRREAERRVRSEERADQRVRQAEERASSIERQWVVERREVHITEEVLGGGGWGEVKVAEFRGTRVAAKSLYQAITSSFYDQLFIREMSMAARLRHPNLVQFIGACMEGGMVILTELLPASLRKELERGDRNMSQDQLKSISLDVARALNYLHQMQPDPIIHRDISSANVLLEPLAGQRWRAKVTDYGSVNFQQQLKTEGPGSLVYASPEAHTPTLQSPKMDIFSFGVLLVEMCTATFPEVSARERLIDSITSHEWVELIRHCTHQDRDKRPPAAEIIAELKQWMEVM